MVHQTSMRRICVKTSDHISVEEVKRVYKELKIRDLTLLQKAEVRPEKAQAILAQLETADEKFI
ncbi:MAG: hypothetical protein ACOWW1_08780 [archaeon]|nr:hypothetical protein [Candidatus Bathyarchaeum sp.]